MRPPGYHHNGFAAAHEPGCMISGYTLLVLIIVTRNGKTVYTNKPKECECSTINKLIMECNS